jgi:hypothetical protein
VLHPAYSSCGQSFFPLRRGLPRDTLVSATCGYPSSTALDAIQHRHLRGAVAAMGPIGIRLKCQLQGICTRANVTMLEVCLDLGLASATQDGRLSSLLKAFEAQIRDEGITYRSSRGSIILSFNSSPLILNASFYRCSTAFDGLALSSHCSAARPIILPLQ